MPDDIEDIQRNIVLQEGRQECIDTLRAAGYDGAADMLAELVDEMQVWIDSNPLEPDDEEPVTQTWKPEPETTDPFSGEPGR